MRRWWLLLTLLTACSDLIGRVTTDASVDTSEASADASAASVDALDAAPLPGCTGATKKSGLELDERRVDLSGEALRGARIGSSIADGRGGVILFGNMVSCVSSSSGVDAVALRVDARGALDTTFGRSGRLCLDTRVNGASASDAFYGATLDADGRIVLVGATSSVAPTRALIARLTPEGALDPSFMSVGWRHVELGPIGAALRAVAFSRGRIVAVGGNATVFATPTLGLAMAFDGTGALATDFGADGVYYDSARWFTDLDARSEGYVFAGTERVALRPSLTRVDRGGVPVADYGRGGVAVHATAARTFSGDLTPDGRGGYWLLGGTLSASATLRENCPAAVVHFLGDGTTDARFGVGGVFSTAEQWSYDYSHGDHIARHCGDRVVVALAPPEHSARVHVYRIDAQGRRDVSFGIDGLADVNGIQRSDVYAGIAALLVDPRDATLTLVVGESTNTTWGLRSIRP